MHMDYVFELLKIAERLTADAPYNNFRTWVKIVLEQASLLAKSDVYNPDSALCIGTPQPLREESAEAVAITALKAEAA